MKKIYILLPVHNRREITQCFINCLKVQTFQNYHLILINDGCNDGTEEMIKSEIQNLTILNGNGNLWWAGSLQKGFEWLSINDKNQDEIILIINDDVTFDKYFLEIGFNLVKTNEDSLVLAQILNEKTGKCEETGIDADLQAFTFNRASSPEKINCLSTRGLFLRQSFIDKIGRLYPFLLPHYWSDYELTIRAQRKGFKLKTFSLLALYESKNTTGLHRTIDINEFDFVKIFSKRSTINPIYSSIFIILVCPKFFIPKNIAKVWIRTIKLFLRWLIKVKIGNIIHTN